MRKKFKIMYPSDYCVPEKAGKPYLPPSNSMVVMNSSGIFFICSMDTYYTGIRKLSDVLYKYDVIWSEK